MARTSKLLAAACLLPAQRQRLTWPWQPQAPTASSHQGFRPGFGTLFPSSRSVLEVARWLLRGSEGVRSVALGKVAPESKENHFPEFCWNILYFILLGFINLWLRSVSKLGKWSCSAARPAAVESHGHGRRTRLFLQVSALCCM